MVRIVSICSREFGALAELTVGGNKDVYCQRHGYLMHELRVPFTNARTAGFERIEYILELMNRRNYPGAAYGVEEHGEDWYWAMGVDTMIMNFSRRLEEFCDQQYHFIIAGDFNGLNADSFLVRNTPQGRAWLEFILAMRARYSAHAFAEQGVMIDWHRSEPWRHWVKVAAQNGKEGINAYEMKLYGFQEGTMEFEKGQWRPGDFLVHWPGRGMEERMRLAKEAAERVVGG